MELPKNITQIGETNPHCKIYVEDYVISYIKQLNSYACDKALAVALYGIRKEEAGITYLFLYGAGKLNFLQRECRHLSQAVLQEVEKLRAKYFPEYIFLGYKLLDGEMIESFYVCEQNVCRSIEGYAQFYEKNDRMLAFMLEERPTESTPEKVDQDKYNVVKKRQEERRALAEEKEGHALKLKFRLPRRDMAVPGSGSLRNMRMTAAAAFVLLGIVGLAAMGSGERLGELQTAARQWMEKIAEKQLPDMVEVSNGSAQAGTIVAEDKLTDAILKENAAADPSPGQDSGLDVSDSEGQSASEMQSPGADQSQSSSGSAENPDWNPGQAVPGAEGSPETNPNQAVPGAAETPDSNPNQTTPGTEENPETNPDQAVPGMEENLETDPDQAVPGTEENPETNPDQTVPDSEETPAAEPVSYTIQKGDTLIGICLKRYGSDERVAEICSLNHISNPDDIKEGAKILLP